MEKMMTIVEIYEEFNSEWILLEDPTTNEDLEVQSGKVLWHSKDRDEVYDKAREIKPKHSAILFTGQLSEEAAIVL